LFVCLFLFCCFFYFVRPQQLLSSLLSCLPLFIFLFIIFFLLLTELPFCLASIRAVAAALPSVDSRHSSTRQICFMFAYLSATVLTTFMLQLIRYIYGV
jgi:hypothetical protein